MIKTKNNALENNNDKRLMEVVNAVNMKDGEAARADMKFKEQGA